MLLMPYPDSLFLLLELIIQVTEWWRIRSSQRRPDILTEVSQEVGSWVLSFSLTFDLSHFYTNLQDFELPNDLIFKSCKWWILPFLREHIVEQISV